MPNAQLQSSLKQQIEFHFKDAHDQAVIAREAALRSYNGIRIAGLLLDSPEARKIQGELNMTVPQIEAAKSLARRYPDPIVDVRRATRDLEEICMITGLLDFPDGHGPQQLHDPNFFSIFTKHIMVCQSEWNKQLSRTPIDQWAYPTLEQFVNQAQPWVAKVNDIYARAKAQLDTLNG